MINEFPKNPNAKALEDIYNQEFYSYLTKEGEEKFLKRLEDRLILKDEQVRKTKLEKKKHEFRKKDCSKIEENKKV